MKWNDLIPGDYFYSCDTEYDTSTARLRKASSDARHFVLSKSHQGIIVSLYTKGSVSKIVTHEPCKDDSIEIVHVYRKCDS